MCFDKLIFMLIYNTIMHLENDCIMLLFGALTIMNYMYPESTSYLDH